MKLRFTLLSFSLILIFAACSSEKKHVTFLQATITVADSLDQTSDFSGIGFLVFRRDSTQQADTLFYATTDSLGQFQGSIEVPLKGIYPVYVTRNQQILASSSLILNEDDTVKITAQLPAYNQTEKIESREYEAREVLARIDKNFGRLAAYVNSGKVKQDTLPTLLTNWSTLYWSVHTKYPKTIASEQAIEESFRLIVGLNDRLLLSKYDSLAQYPNLRIAFARVAADAKARLDGLESALVFLNERENEVETTAQKLQLIRNQIEMLADSNEHERAFITLNKHLKSFETVKGAKSWANYFAKETNRLAPGKSLPEFSLATKKDSISKSTYAGEFYVLEIVGLGDQVYQEQIFEINAVYQMFANYGLKWVTIPLDPQVSIDAFMEEQKPGWLFTNAHNFDSYRLMDSLNVIQVPTRFLVDRNGEIVRKYGPNQLNRLFNDILIAYQTEKKEPNS